MPLDDSSSPQSSTVIQGHPQVITFLYSCAADGQIFEFQLHKTEMVTERKPQKRNFPFLEIFEHVEKQFYTSIFLHGL